MLAYSLDGSRPCVWHRAQHGHSLVLNNRLCCTSTTAYSMWYRVFLLMCLWVRLAVCVITGEPDRSGGQSVVLHRHFVRARCYTVS